MKSPLIGAFGKRVDGVVGSAVRTILRKAPDGPHSEPYIWKPTWRMHPLDFGER
jgi:hypothetical protein